MTATLIELDQRQSNGITVTLLWNRVTDEVAVHVYDESVDEEFELACAPHEASAVFHHPYAFAIPGSPRYRCLTEAVRAAA